MPKKIPTIENCVSAFERLFIPKTRAERKTYIIEKLSKYKGTSITNNPTGISINILARGIKETGQQASIETESTIAALNFESVIEESVLVKSNLKPKPSQKDDFGFVEMKEFRCKIKNVGTVKMMVGRREKGNHFEYCITKLVNKKSRKKNS